MYVSLLRGTKGLFQLTDVIIHTAVMSVLDLEDN